MAAAATPDPTRQVLLIDGPLAGETFTEPDGTAIRYEQPFPPLAWMLASGDPDAPLPEPGTYYVHKYQLAGRVLTVGSVHAVLTQDAIDAMFWRWLASPLAAALARPRPV